MADTGQVLTPGGVYAGSQSFPLKRRCCNGLSPSTYNQIINIYVTIGHRLIEIKIIDKLFLVNIKFCLFFIFKLNNISIICIKQLTKLKFMLAHWKLKFPTGSYI